MFSAGFDLLLRAVPAVAPPVVRGLMSTCSVRAHNRRILDEFVKPKKAFIGIVWHKDFLFVLDYFRGARIVVMVSRSKDGELVARTLLRLGYQTVRGSSSAGGKEALLELTRMVRDGWGSCIIADGPRGPARVSKLGPVIASKESGVPMIPFGCHAERAWKMRNWDQTVIPKPFTRVAIAFGEPVVVPAHASREECERMREEMDRRMAELEATCRRSVARG
ncbi:MAG TPA: lysophospholipid acyltransferase family protein [Planctomycetota bacterium]|nr:lysophospholipid acyltransferase family protein [Planctomycetota bacterium]